MSINGIILTAASALFGAVAGLRRQERTGAFAPVIPALPMPEVEGVESAEQDEPKSEPLRVKVPHYSRRLRTVLHPPKAVDVLIHFLNSEGIHGVFAASEIDEYWLWCAEMLDIEPIDCRFVREAFEGKGLRIGQKRLNTPEFVPVRQRIGKGRAVLYRVPRCRAQAGQSPAEADASPVMAAAARPSSGQEPAIAEKAKQIRRAA